MKFSVRLAVRRSKLRAAVRTYLPSGAAATIRRVSRRAVTTPRSALVSVRRPCSTLGSEFCIQRSYVRTSSETENEQVRVVADGSM